MRRPLRPVSAQKHEEAHRFQFHRVSGEEKETKSGSLMSLLVRQVRPLVAGEVSPQHRGCVSRARLAPSLSHRSLLPPSACLFYDACSIKPPQQYLQPRVICFLLFLRLRRHPPRPPSDVELLQIRAAAPITSKYHSQRRLICLRFLFPLQ